MFMKFQMLYILSNNIIHTFCRYKNIYYECTYLPFQFNSVYFVPILYLIVPHLAKNALHFAYKQFAYQYPQVCNIPILKYLTDLM